MRKKEIKCPYCGSKAKLVHFYDIYGKDATHPERYAWACARFPQCDSYVSTIKGSTKPAGTLADAQLRHERIEAHRVIKNVVESGMDQHSVYRYLEDRMGLQRDQLHIASSGIYYCRLVQQILKSLLERLTIKSQALKCYFLNKVQKCILDIFGTQLEFLEP